MASLSLYPQFETNLMSHRNVIEFLLQLKSAKAHGKNYINVEAHLVRHLLRNRLFRFVEFTGCPKKWPQVCESIAQAV